MFEPIHVPGEIADPEEARQGCKTEKKPKMKGDHSKRDKKHSEAQAKMARCAEFLKSNVIDDEEAGDDVPPLREGNSGLPLNGDVNKKQG